MEAVSPAQENDRDTVEEYNNSPMERNIERVGGYTVITRGIWLLTASELILKLLIDIAGGIIGCKITAILFLFIVPAIFIASLGSVFFTQSRIEKNGKIFKMYKFRSMYLDAEERLKELQSQIKMDQDFMFKLDRDPRIIGSEKDPDRGIGNFIRRTSIDEFPQFINVPKGDMSLCGIKYVGIEDFLMDESFISR